MELPYVKIFLDWSERTQDLSDAEKGRLMDAIIAYAKGEELGDRLKGSEKIVFRHYQLQRDQDVQNAEEKAKRMSENGSKGGRPPKANAFPEKQKKQKVFLESKKSQEEEKEKEEEKEYSSPSIISPKGDAFVDFAGEDQLLLEALKAFEESRKKNRKPMTGRAKELLVGELIKAPQGDWIQMLENATLHGWQSVYPLKPEEKKQTTEVFRSGRVFSDERLARLKAREGSA